MPTVTVTVTDANGNTSTPASASWTVQSSQKIVGYWAPAADYNSKLASVGAAGVEARRIYGDLTAAGNNMASQITAAISAGMLPVVSYKLNGVSIASAATGACDAAATATANYLNSLGVPIAVAVWHEPYDDMTAAQFLAMQRRLIPLMQRPNLKVGFVLHGWLLDTTSNRTNNFEGYIPWDLLDSGAYQWAGIDTYQTGNSTSPGPITPDQRIDPLVAMLTAHGHGDIPLGVGEYNAWTTAGIQSAGEKFLSTPTLWFACMFDPTTVTGVAQPLSGSRLTAYQATKADPRAKQ